ncbi:type I restriction-modification system subunit M [Segatella copri]|uniref:type I restriction-modification system subunit M n=1 Tax=Segatella copri TaxID=165179 RepID=UPI001931A7B9|nr:class I SAM-dependent DNA methyltransferase [Segatella copri]MBM0144220.1 N-6 DNA methylase [Segatella copri]
MAVKKSELYSSLWESCNQLRGGMDASQYKDYVLVVLFLKYISDKAKADKDYLLNIPEGCFWEDILALRYKSNIGERLNEIIHQIAEENDLSGVIDTADFNDDTKLGKGKDKVDTLSKLVTAFTKNALDFSSNRAGDDDLLGDAYEYLMKNFASESGKSKGQFYTPGEVSRVMAKVIGIHQNLHENISIYDPTCGSGSLLLRALSESLHPNNTALFGQEKDINNVGMAKMNMILHGYECSDIQQGDTLNNPQFLSSPTALQTFNYVVANPPFSQKSWLKSAKENDMFERWGNGVVDMEEGSRTPSSIGVPPEKNGDYAFLLHIIKSMAADGKGACILPHGVLFRGYAEGEIRKNIVKAGYIKGLIGLPQNLFYGTGIPACIIILDKQEASDRKGIFMIDAKDGFVKDGNMNRLREEDIQRIVDTWEAWVDVPHYARFVPQEEVEKNDYNLNIPRYIEARDTEIVQNIEAHLKGGLPKHDIDQLSDYWEALPTLKDELVKEQGNGYYAWAVSREQIDGIINDNEDYQTQQATLKHHCRTDFMEQWQETIYDLAESSEKPKTLIERMGQSIRNLFGEGNLLVDEYDAYEQLMNYWAETMQDDVYMIMADGWKLNLRPKQKEDKKEKKMVPVVVKTWNDLESDLLPVEYIVNRFCKSELEACDELSASIAFMENEVTSLVEENDDVFDTKNFEKEKVNLASVKKRAKVTKGEEQARLIEWIELQNSIKAEKAKLKEANDKLLCRVKEEYDLLAQNEMKVKNLVKEKWVNAISTRIESELSRSIEQLKSQLSAISERYDQTLPSIDKEVEDYESRVNAHLAQMGFVL